MSSDNVLVESPRKGVAIVTLNRPERRNALNIAMMQQLVDTLERLASDTVTRVCILRGAGPVFCAGLDLAEAQDPELVMQSAGLVAKTLHTLKFSSLVTIAAVHGGAYAGGGGVAAACDMAAATETCKIGFPEARRGLLPALICDVLKTKVREGDLTDLFLCGEAISAARAQQIGIFQRIVPEADLLSTALQMAENILAGGPKTIVDTKTLVHHAFGHDHLASGSHDASSIDEHLKARFSEEAVEGLRAFIEKRQPSWM
ncbi:MAG: enoyl-CoA hydratase/isomerase family protein [Pirellulales bacterium]